MDFKVLNMTDDKIWRLMQIFCYCSVPPVLLVLTITFMYGLVNSSIVMNDCMIVFFQQSFPIFLCYAIIPCIFFKMFKKFSLEKIGIKRNRLLWIDIFDFSIFLVFIGYLLVIGVFQ